MEKDFPKIKKIEYVRKETVDQYVLLNQKFFPSEKIIFLKEKLYALDEASFSAIASVELKDPTSIFLVSLFLGNLGIDRFMVGDIGFGILKLLTAGCCGILYLFDLFTIQRKAKKVNFNNLLFFMNDLKPDYSQQPFLSNFLPY